MEGVGGGGGGKGWAGRRGAVLMLPIYSPEPVF